MPYINKDLRAAIDAGLGQPTSSGELNYAITKLITEYVKTRHLCYSTINDITGALENAKLEFYRRVAVPYENAKITANGDVYG